MSRSSLLWLVTLLTLPAWTLWGGPVAPETPAISIAAVVSDADSETNDLSWLPKNETEALQFLKENPDADGRRIVVAIFDTGVDPGAAGLQTTPDGRPKVIDLVDGTGSGDVKMGELQKAEEGKLTGLTGRELKLSTDWKNPTGEYRLGLKAGYELFPSELVKVIQAERQKEFRKNQAARKAQLQRQLAQWKKQHPKPDEKQKAEQKELEAQIELVDELLKDYSDPGPLYDCLVFHDGKHLRAVVDTNEDGNLADEKVLTNYRAERGFSTFADPINLNFAVNIYENGETLSIVADTGAHGTHVAGIVAAHYPDQPEWNGVAPGAQIVSVKIGDTRLDGMENGPGLVRGLKAVLENNCDLINMSYGEQTSVPNAGRIAELYAEIVNEHDVIFVSSAGNSGPALSTVGAPGGTTSALIGVGAYVSPEMMRSEYSLRQKLPGLPYTWTSRGPTADGDLGVDIFAPGGAIAPVPVWTRQASQLMNGTSMASPNACGNIALMLSAAKQKEIAYTPHSVRKAIQNTAQELPDAEAFAAGPGLIQIQKAWNYLTANADSYAEKLTYEVLLPTLNNARGIYLRETYQTRAPQSFRVMVSASLKEKAAIQERLDVSISMNMKSTAEWVHCGDLLHLTHGGNRFDILVDPTGLPEGVHYAEVQAFDRARPEAGPLFRVPVTVVRPLQAASVVEKDGQWEKLEDFEPGIVHRNFLEVPEGATWAELSMTLIDTDEPKFFRIHTMQLIEGSHFEKTESGSYYGLNPGVETVHTFPVTPGRTLEVDLAQYWSILGASKVKYRLQFHSLSPDERRVALATGAGPQAITLRNQLIAEKLSPKGSLTTWRRTLQPKKQETQALNLDRDQLPDGSAIYEMTLHYELEQAAKSQVTLRVLPLQDLLYDAPVGPFLTHITDQNGQRLTTNDMFPDGFSLEKGTYQVTVVMQHHDPAMLEKFEKLSLNVDQPLSSPVGLNFWSSAAAAAKGQKGGIPGLLVPQQSHTLYLGEPSLKSLPSSLKSGDYLIGELTYTDDEQGAAQFVVEYYYSKPEEKSSASDSSSGKSLAEQIRNVQLAHLKTLKPDSEEFQKLFTELRKADQKDRRPLITRLELLDTEEKRKERLAEVITAAEELIQTYPQDEIAQILGKRVPSDDQAAKKAHEAAEKQKKELIDALYRKARAIAYRELPEVVAQQPIENQEKQDQEFQQAVSNLEVWADLSEEDYFLLKVRQERRDKHFAQAIQLLNKEIEEPAKFLYLKKRRDLLGELGWEDWRNWQQHQLLLKFPQKKLPY